MENILSRIYSNSITPEEFLKRICVITNKMTRKGRRYKSGEVRIFRSRVFCDIYRPNRISEISYPPIEKIKLGRANMEKEQVFYASAGLPTTFVEGEVKSNNFVIVSEWKNKREMVLQEIGLKDGQNNGLNDIEDIFHKIFTSLDDKIYKYSSVLASHLMSGKQISGILYSSVVSQNKSHNIALKKEYVDRSMDVTNATLYKVVEAREGFIYKVDEVDFATPINGFALEWKKRRKRWVIREDGGELKMVSNGWGYDAYRKDGTFVSPE